MVIGLVRFVVLTAPAATDPHYCCHLSTDTWWWNIEEEEDYDVPCEPPPG